MKPIENVLTGSTFRSSFGDDYGVTFESAPLTGLLSRSVVVIDAEGNVLRREEDWAPTLVSSQELYTKDTVEIEGDVSNLQTDSEDDDIDRG